MDVAPETAALALADLTELSAQIEAAVVASPDGQGLASTLPEPAAAAFARAAAELLREAGDRAVGAEAATREGSLFAVRDGERLVAAVTGRAAPSGLVLYDLRTCLRRLAEEPKPAKKRARGRESRRSPMRRRSLVLLGALAGAAALVARRRAAAPRVDVYYEDGSMASLEPGLPQAERMLAAARHAVALARTA